MFSIRNVYVIVNVKSRRHVEIVFLHCKNVSNVIALKKSPEDLNGLHVLIGAVVAFSCLIF